jgi:3-isopropylmalate/(R)-2-methylmalate dehydratase large subunit
MMAMPSGPLTLFEKIWHRHVVHRREDGECLLYVDCHLVQDGSAPGFEMLRQKGLPVRMPQRTFGTPDHYIPTRGRDLSTIADPEKRAMARALENDCQQAGIPFFGLQDMRQGIIHVVAPEQGITQPGRLMVCGDSHTSTHGALGALAFGIGASEVSHVLATQTIWQRQPRTMKIEVSGALPAGVTAKDIILAIIGRIGAGGAVGHVIEYTGEAIRQLSMEGRMTLCNMSIEAGARAGMVAPDDTTYRWLQGRPHAPQEAELDACVEQWRHLPSDAGARFDREVVIPAREIEPMVTWGNSPEQVAGIGGRIPDPAQESDAQRREGLTRTLAYMGLQPGQALAGLPIQRVFIGSCTNGRIEDLRSAAAVARHGRVAPGVEAWVVPGSGLVKRQAEAEGLHEVFLAAGFQWRDPGCSMCLGTNGDIMLPGQRSASTSNRNFVGRQGPGSRTHLVSPAMAAAAALQGCLVDVRTVRGH